MGIKEISVKARKFGCHVTVRASERPSIRTDYGGGERKSPLSRENARRSAHVAHTDPHVLFQEMLSDAFFVTTFASEEVVKRDYYSTVRKFFLSIVM